ncbi:MAG: cation:dicarboxylase symporter family transporter, partial [Pseudomonadota bacterium]|nr:cation:dicarboxylase symporter family transporter [Pseudomonadota bacterium]
MPHRHAVWLLAAIVLGVVAGGVSGWYFGEAMVAVGWLGELFLRTLKMLILPLIIAAVISGVAALGDVRKLGRVGWLTLTYYLVTTATAVFIGLVVVNLIEPGVGLTPPSDHAPDRIAAKADTGVVDILLSLVDANLVDAAANTRLLPIILFSILLAAALTTVGQRGVEVIRFFEGVNEAMMRLVIWLMYLAPVGIFALVAARLGQAGGGDAFFQEL